MTHDNVSPTACTTSANADLWFPGRQDPIGLYPGGNHARWPPGADRLRYVKWVDVGRPYSEKTGPELAPRQAFHVFQRDPGRALAEVVAFEVARSVIA